MDVRAQMLKALEMRGERAAANLVAAGTGCVCLAKTPQQRPQHHDGGADGCRQLAEFLRGQHLQIHIIGLEGERVFVELGDLHPHQREDVLVTLRVADVGQVGNRHRRRREQHGGKHLQGLVLGPLRHNLSMQLMTAFYNKL